MNLYENNTAQCVKGITLIIMKC